MEEIPPPQAINSANMETQESESMLLNGTNSTVRTNNWSSSSSAAGHGTISNGVDISGTR
jgi:hypothetical protein